MALKQAEKTALSSLFVYHEASLSFVDFLKRTHTEESKLEMDLFEELNSGRKQLIDFAMETIERRIKAAEEMSSCSSQRSHRSIISRRSSKVSNMSVALVEKRMKAESAKVALNFAEKEAALLRKQAEIDENEAMASAKTKREKIILDADLAVIKQQKEAAIAEAEINAFLSVNGSNPGSSVCGRDLDLDLETEDPQERTRLYVKNGISDDPMPPPIKTVAVSPAKEAPTSVLNLSQGSAALKKKELTDQKPSDLRPKTAEYIPRYIDNAGSLTVQQSSRTLSSNPAREDCFIGGELSRFLLRKELLLSRLACFDDRPESFNVWKATFQSIALELQVSPAEELDMLVKWLGPDSGKHALRLRSANVSDPTKALTRVWDRLDERFGCVEVVESTLKQRLASFAKITNKEFKRLYD